MSESKKNQIKYAISRLTNLTTTTKGQRIFFRQIRNSMRTIPRDKYIRVMLCRDIISSHR